MVLTVDTQCATPIYVQLRDQIVRGIAAGQLAAGEGLPSVRRLAADLGINLHTVRKAYDVLSVEGYVRIDRRKGVVAALPEKVSKANSLTSRLTLLAAEARCHSIDEEAFISLCRKAYEQSGRED